MIAPPDVLYPLPMDSWLEDINVHQSHPEIVTRLKRAEGHLRMIENGRTCLDIAQQLHAVEKAVANAKRTLIHDHIDHCLKQTVGPMSRGARGPLEEFKEITKYL